MNSKAQKLDEKYMSRAFGLAEKGEGRTSPNPPVGCVLVRDNKIIGKGFHKKAGEPHAEINAISDAKANGFDTKDSTIYITLEPCCFFGKTPPCTEAIINAGIKRVVFSILDPDKRSMGKSIPILQEADIDVSYGILEEQGNYLLHPFRTLIEKKRSFVVIKYASTLDGRIAATTGDSKWISGEESRELAHIFRDKYDSILIGANTLIKDDPRLTVRWIEGRNPIRFIMGGNKIIPASKEIFNDNAARTIVITQLEKPFGEIAIPKGIEIWKWDNSEKYVSIADLAKRAAKEGINSIMIEGGQAIITSALESGVVDRIHTVIAPSILGTGIAAVGNLKNKSISQALNFKFVDVRRIGKDILLTSQPLER